LIAVLDCNDDMASIASRRLAKELSEIKSEGCPVGEQHTLFAQTQGTHTLLSGINLVKADDFSTW
jgi:ubiquitin-conjugating enzyme E2 W